MAHAGIEDGSVARGRNARFRRGDCGVLEFDYLRLLENWLRDNGKPVNLGSRARRLMGDMSVLGKGEMLILA